MSRKDETVALKTFDLRSCDIRAQSCDLRDPERTLWPRTYCVSLGALPYGSGFVYTQMKPFLPKETIYYNNRGRDCRPTEQK